MSACVSPFSLALVSVGAPVLGVSGAGAVAAWCAGPAAAAALEWVAVVPACTVFGTSGCVSFRLSFSGLQGARGCSCGVSLRNKAHYLLLATQPNSVKII